MLSRIVSRSLVTTCLWVFGFFSNAQANIPGGGTGTGANVTLTSTSTTATMSNGVVSILCTKSGATINQINYTYDNGSGSTTTKMLSGGYNGGQLYWEFGGFADTGGSYVYSVVVDPAVGDATHAVGDYAEISVLRTSPDDGAVDVHFSMRRGSPGFYVTAIWSHRASDIALSIGETRNNIYVGSIFNWMSVDATRNKLFDITGSSRISVPTAPVECSLWTAGIYQGQYEDKYKYSATFGDQRVWGWSSVGTGNKNVGLWDVSATAEYYNGGPLKPELMCHLGQALLNMFNGGHYGMGGDGAWTAGEVWNKVYGPYFVYCNNVSSSLTDPVQASQALYNDALAQGAAEASAWPYIWFSNANYAGPANRGTVTGKIVINDPYNPSTAAANLWVGLVRQPATSGGVYDFQNWMKPYQFWVHSDANGNFTVPAVVAGSNYTLYAFGQGANDTFMSQAQTGGSPPFLADIPASPFGVTVVGGATTALGEVTWTPARVGPTVFEIGYPDRTARKFRHGEDWWVGDIGSSPANPSPVWTKFLEFPFDFPSGPNYTVGTSRWSTDWNFIQPVIYSSSGGWDSSSSTITFNLASKPASGTQASIYLGLASDYYTALIVTVNGTNLASAAGLVATPSVHPSTGFVPSSSKSDGSIREFNNGAYSDERLTFAGTLLSAGVNTIKISQRQVGGTYFANHAMYDYLRLELTNYVPPAPASVTAFAGNNSVLVSWPVVPGATSYKVLRSTTNGSGYVSLVTGVTGPVCGSGPTNANYVDGTAGNGTTYYYVVQSVNSVSASANSAQSAAVTPSASAAVSSPSAPAGLTAAPGSGSVTLSWNASSGANYYTVKRSTLYANGGGTYNNLGTIMLGNAVTGTTYTDASPTNGSTYAYTVAATNSAGSGPDSAAATVTPRATAPTMGPTTLTATALQNSNAGGVTLNWSAVAGAGGYVVQRATAAAGPYAFLYSLAALTATNTGLAANTTYYYQVATTNSGGTSSFVTASATTPPAAPANFAATAGASKVTLTWTASPGAVSYVIGRSTTAGGPYATIAGAVTGSTYTDLTATNNVVNYYVIAATGTVGTGANSLEANATPVGVPTLTWTGTASTAWDTTTTNNWLNGSAAAIYADPDNVTFDDTATTTTVVASGTVNPNAVVFNNVTASYAFTATGLSGPATLGKLGAGSLSLTGTAAYTGGTTIGEGAIVLGKNVVANAQNGLGTGTVTLQGGTLTMNGYTGSNGSSYGTLANNLNVPAGSTGGLNFTQRGAFTGGVTGGGILNLAVDYVRGDNGGDWSAFTGQINVVRTRTSTNVDQLRLTANTGFGTAAVYLGPYVQLLTTINASTSYTVGELGGDVNARLTGIVPNSGSPGSFAVTYVVGGRNTNAAFAGSISNGTSPSVTALTKEGVGTWTLSGANTYTGATAVNGGTLKITGSVSNTSSLAIAPGGTLALSGGIVSVAGPVTNQGTVRMSGAASLTSTGIFTNYGIVDLINGPQTLPGNFVNQGTVVDSSVVAVESIAPGANGSCTVIIAGYAGHTYQLVSTPALSTPNWQNAGNSQSVPVSQGGPVSITLTDASATGGAKFYRVLVTTTP